MGKGGLDTGRMTLCLNNQELKGSNKYRKSQWRAMMTLPKVDRHLQ